MPNLCVEAGPGTGKTYTLTNARLVMALPQTEYIKRSVEQQAIFDWCCKNLPRNGKVAFFAFGRSIVAKLKKEILKDDYCNTFNGFGQSQIIKKWGYTPLNNERLQEVVSEITGVLFRDMQWDVRKRWTTACKMADLCKKEWMLPSDTTLQYLVERYPEFAERSPPEDIIPDVLKILDLCRKPKKYGIDYTDQVWLGALLTQQPVFDTGFVDESQDQSRVCLELAKKSCKNLVYCGDPNQAIFGFNGADYRAFERVKADSQDILPLKLSFRCPPNICDKANLIRPSAKLRPMPEKADGIEITIDRNDLQNYISKHNHNPYEALVLCRTNAPLVRTCLSLLRSGVKCFLLENDITKSIMAIVRSFKIEGPSNDNIFAKVKAAASQYRDEYRGHKSVALEMLAEEREQTIIAVCDSLQGMNHSTEWIKSFESKIKELYRYNDRKEAIAMSTIHKAKGLEAGTVYIINPPVPHFLAVTPDAIEQEKNLEFVAVTRTKRDLIWVKNC